MRVFMPGITSEKTVDLKVVMRYFSRKYPGKKITIHFTTKNCIIDSNTYPVQIQGCVFTVNEFGT